MNLHKRHCGFMPQSHNRNFLHKIICLILLFLGLTLQCFAADVMPSFVSLSNTNTLGLYQTGDTVVLRKTPEDNAEIIKVIRVCGNEIEPSDSKFEDVFVVYNTSKNLALMAVTDETEDWVELIYNNKTGARGWMKKDDPYKFSTWVNFYNTYAKKYGLYLLNGTPESVKNMHGSTEDDSKVISTINRPQKIKLNIIRGNWMLVSVMDADRTPKTGYIRWRSEDGIKYLFPAIK